MTVSPLPPVPPPHALPLGSAQPSGQRHAISVSLPTWEAVPGRPLGKKWVIEKMQANYPRFCVHCIVQKLGSAVLERIAFPAEKTCFIFPSEDAGIRCAQFLQKNHGPKTQTELLSFYLPETDQVENARWARFSALIYSRDVQKTAEKFWTIFGDGISSRHAEFCLERFDMMCTGSSNGTVRSTAEGTQAVPRPSWTDQTERDLKAAMRGRIAKLISSDHSHMPQVIERDVFLYPKGMCAISAVARSLVPDEEHPSQAVVYGWPYSETPKCVGNSGYERFLLCGQGSQDELDQLSASLATGMKIQALFCEIPSNPLLHTPDLHRIRELADQYGFCVVCDETLGTYVNVDILPYVDVAITSLTKIFSGGSDVMGGSVVINPLSRHYETLHSRLAATYQDLLFPGDAIVLAHNSATFPERVRQANTSTLALVKLIANCPSVQSIYYPKLVSTAHLYERYRRANGGYGFLFSILFHKPASAVVFYDNLDICKGPNLGANFSLALPYAQLSHVHELDWAESQGLPKHIVRISVGLETEAVLVDRVRDALKEVQRHESVSDL